jgi:hypothetical protein
MWNPRVKAIIWRAGKSCAGSGVAAGTAVANGAT